MSGREVEALAVRLHEEWSREFNTSTVLGTGEPWVDPWDRKPTQYQESVRRVALRLIEFRQLGGPS